MPVLVGVNRMRFTIGLGDMFKEPFILTLSAVYCLLSRVVVVYQDEV